MKVYAFVPAKGTSERVENKNMRYLDGERLYIRALKTLLQCKEVDQVFLDTESVEMYNLADYLPIKFMKRDPSLANNNTDGHQMFMNEVNNNPDADIYVQLLCTSPFIHPETIDNAIIALKENPEYDSAILMKKDKYYFWKDGKPTYDINHIPNSKDLPETIIESMGLYIVKKEAACKCHRRYGEKPLLIYGQLDELIDVNTQDDMLFAQTFAQGQRICENQKLKLLKHFITSAALSDLLDDIAVEKNEICGAVIDNLKCNIKNYKLFGRANTLKLRKLEENEDFRGIYNATAQYDSIADNDIIVVENEINDYAYFGDLNARLAIRAGASGAIILGKTRDNVAVSQLNFPVYSYGYNPTDVRRRATLDYINKPIQINGIKITPGDLIFADECGVVVIYQKYEKEILETAIKVFINEKNIISDILDQKQVKEIMAKRGAF